MIPKAEQASREELRKRLDYRYREIVEESSVDPDVASERDYYLEKTKTGLQRLGFTRTQQQAPAIVIPRFSPSGEEIPPQIKPDSPRLVETRGKLREVKYDYPPNTPVRLSVHPRAVKMMRDRRYPLWITEGDKKGDALVSRGAVAVVLQGVDCWKVPQDWEDVKLHGRECIVAFDADTMVNPNVQRALKALAAFLQSRGAVVKYVRWPEKYRGTKTGIDDFLAAGDGAVEDLYQLADEAPDEEAVPVGVSMADIKPECVEWLWSRRIPKGKVTILDGDPGKGKSTILYDLAARITSGQPLPDGEPVETGGALIVSAEDGAADTIVPRFLAAGGDPKKARIIGSEEQFIIPDDLDKLERAILQTGATFVVIDPVMSFLSDDINSNRDQDVRRALQPLVNIAQRTGAAIVICRHLNKSSGGPAIYRGQGSIGFIGIVRSGLVVGEHPEQENTFVLAGQKHNLSRPPESLAYRIGSAGPGDGTARIEYRGTSEVTAAGLNATPGDEGERGRLVEAKEFLRELLRPGPEFVGRIKAEAKEAEIGWRTVERAKADLKAQAVKDPKSGKWQWVLPGPPDEGDEDRHLVASSPRRPNVGGLGGDGGLQDSSSRPPTLAVLAAFNSTTTTTTFNKGYIREDRQDRQDRQQGDDRRRGDEEIEGRQVSANEGRQVSANEGRQVSANDYLAKAQTLAGRLGRSGSKEPEYRAAKNCELIPFPAISTNGHNGLPKKEEKRPDFTQADFLAANEELAKTHSLIYRDEDVDEAISWLKPLTDVAVDIETYGTAHGAPARKKEALSFVKSRIRLIQLSSFARDETYLLDTMFLSTKAVVGILENLRGKALYCHNGIFDIPRLEKHFGVDLADEDIRDTLVLSRLARAGEWVKDRRTKTGMRPYRHDIRSVLIQEKVAEIPNETDHRWHEPLNEERLRYAQDDVCHLIELYPRLMDLIEERSLGRGLELFKRVYPVYLRMQSRGVPFDKKLFSEFTEKLDANIEVARSRIEEHKPEHPEGGTWAWRNNQPINDTDPATGAGRNGARRALLEAAINLPNLKKHTRLEYLKTHPGEAPLLDALHEYLRYSDLKSDCKTWLTYHYEDDRLYPNVKPFSQETGRSAYADPPIQNIPKEADEELGISLRDCIKANPGTRLIKADYAAQELRILAHITGDEKLITSFAEGVDPHIVVGEQITGHSLEKGTTEYKTYRKLGKRANYGFSYGAGAARYAQSAYEDTAERVSEEQARAEQEAFRTAWPGVYRWQQEFGDADGNDETDWYTLSFVGRRRYVGQKKDKYSGGYKPSYCDRLNAPIQSGGADMLYVALELLLKDKEDGLFPEVEVIITTHDEIVLEAPEEVGKSTQAWLERRMQDAARRFLREELAGEDCVEGEVGPSWGGE